MWSVRRALVLVTVLTVAVPMMLFWAWPHSRALQNEVDHVREKHLVLARNLGAALDRYSRDLVSTFDYLADGMLAGRPIVAPDQLLRSLKIRHLCLVDIPSGKILSSLGGLASPASGTLSKEVVARLVATAAERGSLPSHVMPSADGAPALFLVRTKGDRLVLANADTSYFRELAGAVSFGIKGHAAIVDQTGRVLAHPRPDFAREMKDISKVSAVRRMMQGETGVQTFYSPALKAEMIAGFTHVPKTGWGVMVPQPLSELKEAASRINTSALSILSLGLVAAALVALRFSMLVVTPLKSVIAGAERMAAGETSVEIALPGRLVPCEFRVLASTFNAMARSVSQARAAEAEARERAERANSQKSEFVRYLTHELRSPVNAILGFANVLADECSEGRGDARMADQVRQIEDAGTHLLSLINDLLDLGKIEAGHYSLHEEVIGVDEVLSRVSRMIANLAAQRNMTVDVHYEKEPPAILADERAMYQVILNLATNAVRYGLEGGHVAMTAKTAADGGVVIDVSDDGPGIAPENLERVMKPFERIERPGEAPSQGTGLGLPIVKRLVELHGGRFTLLSAPGRGTTARIELPAGRRAAGPSGDPAQVAA
jgi:signal transduction histidine kinase